MRRTLWLVGCVALLAPAGAGAQTADNVLLVINERNADSVRIGEHYAAARRLPATHVVRVQAPTTDVIERRDFSRTIETPIGAWLLRHSLQDQVLYLVLTKGVPLRVAGTGGREGSTASVDSELTLLYRKLLGMSVPIVGRVPNPYFHDERPMTEAQPFTRFGADVYLVTRLDGFSADDVVKLIDRGLAPSAQGRVVLDEKRAVLDSGGDEWLEQAAERLRAMGAGERVLLEVTSAAATSPDPVVGYYSWGSNDPANTRRRLGLTFAPGAIGAMYVSGDARTFTAPRPEWTPTPGAAGAGGSPFLAGDLIREGITGLGATVSEPFLDATLRPQVLFPAYMTGFNLAESFYLSMPYLSWQTVVIGDPLCVPFTRTPVAAADLAGGFDAETTLPAIFAERRLKLLAADGYHVEGLKPMMKMEALAARGDHTQMEALLVRATELEPRLTSAHLQLGMHYDGKGDRDRAIARYQQVLALDPQNAVALNNLAYVLAVHRGKPAEALPLAERAYRVSRLATVADTLGWIHHLMGHDEQAAPLLEQAAAGLPDNADVRIHAAIVALAVGDPARARRHLDSALVIDPGLAARADVKALREKLK